MARNWPTTPRNGCCRTGDPLAADAASFTIFPLIDREPPGGMPLSVRRGGGAVTAPGRARPESAPGAVLGRQRRRAARGRNRRQRRAARGRNRRRWRRPGRRQRGYGHSAGRRAAGIGDGCSGGDSTAGRAARGRGRQQRGCRAARGQNRRRRGCGSGGSDSAGRRAARPRHQSAVSYGCQCAGGLRSGLYRL